MNILNCPNAASKVSRSDISCQYWSVCPLLCMDHTYCQIFSLTLWLEIPQKLKPSKVQIRNIRGNITTHFIHRVFGNAVMHSILYQLLELRRTLKIWTCGPRKKNMDT